MFFKVVNLLIDGYEVAIVVEIGLYIGFK